MVNNKGSAVAKAVAQIWNCDNVQRDLEAYTLFNSMTRVKSSINETNIPLHIKFFMLEEKSSLVLAYVFCF